MSTKTERALRGPSWAEIILGVLLSVIVGAVLAAAWLVFKPVAVVREIPKEPAKDVVYHIDGSNSSANGRQWMRKRQLFAEGTTVSVNEDELNAAVSNLAPQADKKDGEGGMIAPGAVSFRIHDGRLQISAPVQLNLAGLQSKVLVSANGVFVRRGDHFVFVPDTLYVGSCPVQHLPVVPGLIMQRLFGAVAVPEDLTAAWSKLANVSIEDNHLQLAMP